jgi:hypothetical protein
MHIPAFQLNDHVLVDGETAKVSYVHRTYHGAPGYYIVQFMTGSRTGEQTVIHPETLALQQREPWVSVMLPASLARAIARGDLRFERSL